MISAYRHGPTIRLGFVCAVLAPIFTACGPESAATTDSETTTGSTGTTTNEPTGGEPTTGAPPPVVDCEQVPLVLDAPRWIGALGEFPEQVAVGQDGDAVLLMYDEIVRTSGGGVVWTFGPAADEYPGVIATLPDGQVVAGGGRNEEPASSGLLLRLGPDGERLQTQIVDLDPERSESIHALAVNAAGEVFTATMVSVPDDTEQLARLRIDHFDAALAHVASADAGQFRFLPALAADDDGNTYLATLDLMSAGDVPNIEYTWTLQVRSFGPDGAPRWTADEFAIVTQNELVDLEISVGDQVYALMSNRWGHALRALSRAGEHKWTRSKNWGEVDDHSLRAVVASPCGGAYVGGRTDVEIDFISERASLFHVAADGTFGQVTHLLDTPQDNYSYGRTETLAISPLGAIIAVGALYPEVADSDELPWIHGY